MAYDRKACNFCVSCSFVRAGKYSNLIENWISYVSLPGTYLQNLLDVAWYSLVDQDLLFILKLKNGWNLIKVAVPPSNLFQKEHGALGSNPDALTLTNQTTNFHEISLELTNKSLQFLWTFAKLHKSHDINLDFCYFMVFHGISRYFMVLLVMADFRGSKTVKPLPITIKDRERS